MMIFLSFTGIFNLEHTNALGKDLKHVSTFAWQQEHLKCAPNVVFIYFTNTNENQGTNWL